MPKFRVLYNEVYEEEVELEAKDRADAMDVFYETYDPTPYDGYEVNLISVDEIVEAID